MSHSRLEFKVNFAWESKWLEDDRFVVDRRGKKTLGPRTVLHGLGEDNIARELQKLLVEYAESSNEISRLEREKWEIDKNMGAILKGKMSKEKEELLERLVEKSTDLYSKILEERSKLDEIRTRLKEIESIGRHLTAGLPPSHVIELPVVDTGSVEEGNKGLEQEGLELENLLKAMVMITQDPKKFNIYTRNCSFTVATVIEAGISEKDKSLKMKAKAFFGILTPQIVYDSARKMQHYYSTFSSKRNDTTGIIEKFVEFLKELKDHLKPKEPQNLPRMD